MENKQYPHPLVTVDEDRNQLPGVFATATFAAVDDRFFIVTPRHALISLGGKPAQVFLGRRVLDLAKKRFVTASGLDLAVSELSPTEVDEVFQYALFVTEDTLGAQDHEHVQCVLQGFPANRNKMKIRQKPFIRNVHQIFCVDKTNDYDPSDRLFCATRIALDYDERKLTDNSGEAVNKRQLAGMSGGIVMQVGSARGVLGGLPYGILLSQDKVGRALVCLRYSIVLRCIKENIHRFEAGVG